MTGFRFAFTEVSRSGTVLVRSATARTPPVVALVVPILLLARSIGDEAPKINKALGEAVRNTAPLGALRTTIDYAVTIIGGLKRGRERLGG